MRYLLVAMLIATILVGCSKGSDTPAVKKPGMGTTWTYRYTKFKPVGGILEQYNIRYKITAQESHGGENWFVVTDSAGAVVRLLNTGTDGLFQYVANAKSLLCKDPASVGDSYLSQNESGDITYTVKAIAVDIGTPGGAQNVNRYEGIQNSLTKDILWYNPTAWIVREDYYTVNPFTMINYVTTRIELVSVAY
ncbi:MAG TPA: hypothetical protein VJT83_03840 [Chitinophagaceae bacterium]|nr:hypothetical protein [Chitinophagaceae bacterium]